MVEKIGYSCTRSSAKPSNIVKNIIHDLYEADLVIAVMTDNKPLVWYELGIRHTLTQGTIMLVEKGQKLEFDTSHYGYIIYEDGKSFEDEFIEFVGEIEKRNKIDNPVFEFLHGKLGNKSARLIENLNDLDLSKISGSCVNLDIHTHDLELFIRVHRKLIKDIFHRNGIIRVVLPNYDNDSVLQVILRRFPEYTHDEIKTIIKQTQGKLDILRNYGKGKKQGKLRCFYVSEVGYYSGMKFDNHTLVMTFYNHVREDSKSEAPTLMFDLGRNPEIGDWFDKEFKGLMKRSERPISGKTKEKRNTKNKWAKEKPKLLFDKVISVNGQTGTYATIESTLLGKNSGSLLTWAKISDEHNHSRTPRYRYILAHSTNEGQSIKSKEYVYANAWSISRRTFPNSNENTWCFWTTNSKGEGQERVLISRALLDPGWHLFAITWSKEKDEVLFYIDGMLEASGKFEFWPDIFEPNIFVGTWPNRFLNHYFNSPLGPVIGFDSQLEQAAIANINQMPPIT